MTKINGKAVTLRFKGSFPRIEGLDMDYRIWDLISPKLPGYNYSLGCYPTFGLATLKEKGLVP